MAFGRKSREPVELSDDRAAARTRAVECVAIREHSCAELYEKLCRTFTEEAAAEAVAAMLELQYLDDARYARVKANGLYRRHKSRREAARALRLKGVGAEDAEAALEEIYAVPDDTDAPEANPEVAAAAALVQRQYARKLAMGREDLVRAALARRGFSYGVIRAALAVAAEEQG